jgi:hypothetical protein
MTDQMTEEVPAAPCRQPPMKPRHLALLAVVISTLVLIVGLAAVTGGEGEAAAVDPAPELGYDPADLCADVVDLRVSNVDLAEVLQNRYFEFDDDMAMDAFWLFNAIIESWPDYHPDDLAAMKANFTGTWDC